MKTTLTLAALAAAAGGLCAPAHADVSHDFGVVNGTASATLADTFTGAQTFLYTFEVAVASQVFAGWSAVPTETGTAFNGTTESFDLTGGPYTGLQYYVNTPEGGSFSLQVAPGTYTLSFTAFTQPSTAQARFTTEAAITSISAAVPEPETYALLLAGVLATGFLARRRFG